MIVPTLPLDLTGLEVVYLTDSVRNDDAAQGLPDRDAFYPLGRDAHLLLGSAYRELVKADGIAPGPVRLMVTEEQAWLFRSKVRTGDVGIDGTTNVGVSLLTKLYALLAGFDAERLTSTLPVGDVQERELDNFDRLTLRIAKETDNA